MTKFNQMNEEHMLLYSLSIFFYFSTSREGNLLAFGKWQMENCVSHFQRFMLVTQLVRVLLGERERREANYILISDLLVELTIWRHLRRATDIPRK